MSIQVFDSTSATQIIYLNVSPDQKLDQKQTNAGTQWSKALDLITAFKGLLRLYWGRRLEEPEKVQLHLGCDFLLAAIAAPDFEDVHWH